MRVNLKAGHSAFTNEQSWENMSSTDSNKPLHEKKKKQVKFSIQQGNAEVSTAFFQKNQ